MEPRKNSFARRRSHLAIVRRPLQIVFQVHFHIRRQQIVHHNQSDVFAIALEAIEAEKLGQQCARILAEIQIVAGQQFLQEFALLVLHGFDDELIVAGQIEYGPGSARIGQFAQRCRTHGHLPEFGELVAQIQSIVRFHFRPAHHEIIGLDVEQIAKEPERRRGVNLEFELAVVMGRCLRRTFGRK